MSRPDFTLTWAGSRPSIPAISAGNYAAGWDTYLGPLPPLGDDHDYVMNLQDRRAVWLGGQMLKAVGHEWQADITYDAFAVVRSPVNGQLYRSLVGSNLGNEPSASGAQWALGVSDAKDLLNTQRIDVASASTVNLTTSAPNTRNIRLTGSATVNQFTVTAGQRYLVQVDGAQTFTNGAAISTGTGADLALSAGASFELLATANNVVSIALLSSGRQSNIRLASLTAASGNAILLSGIPAWANRINLFFYGLSTNSTSPVTVRLGTSGGVDATGYLGSYGGPLSAVLSTGFQPGGNNNANDSRHMNMILSRISGNIWSASCVHALSDAASVYQMSGSKELSGALDRIQITTVGGTATFDAGSVNISWE